MGREPDKNLYEELVGNQSASFQKQYKRTIRQKERMQAVQETLKNDQGIDFDSGMKVQIVTAPFSIGTWYPALIEAYEHCKNRGWGIALVQECLFLGCYDNRSVTLPGQVAFECWFSALALL